MALHGIGGCGGARTVPHIHNAVPLKYLPHTFSFSSFLHSISIKYVKFRGWEGQYKARKFQGIISLTHARKLLKAISMRRVKFAGEDNARVGT